jgi:glycine cleavage system regulatory protein
MAKIYLIVTTAGRDKSGTVETIAEVIVTHFANNVKLPLKGD